MKAAQNYDKLGGYHEEGTLFIDILPIGNYCDSDYSAGLCSSSPYPYPDSISISVANSIPKADSDASL